MDMNKAFPKTYLDALQDIGPLGTEMEATIRKVEMGSDIGEDKTEKPLVHFQEFEKPMVWNVTNNKILVSMHGADSNDWLDKKVVLYSTETEFGGEIKPCIRVRQGLAT